MKSYTHTAVMRRYNELSNFSSVDTEAIEFGFKRDKYNKVVRLKKDLWLVYSLENSGDSGNPYTPKFIYTVTKPHYTTRSKAQQMPFPYPKYSGMMFWSLEATVPILLLLIK
ncbi:unnamed protein product [Leptidea sinapis]|uniref:Uncharacterized protein n=1 Tax=Leptidea sinapis TaxID=189913 RepID=A0A5E4Q100_9NEOP|nr:unnamed protein product [Leptidea sinapis]